MAKKPYRLLKRGSIWYYKLPHETTFHSTKHTFRSRAENFVLEQIESQDKLPDVTLKEYAKSFFKWDECDWIKRQHSKGRSFSRSVADHRRSHLDNHILPVFGKMLLRSIDQVSIENWLVSLDLANQTKNHILYSFRIVLREAERQKLISENPLEKVEAMGKDSQSRDILSLEELSALFPKDEKELIKIWSNWKYAACFMILATTGIRSGEVRALRWKDQLPQGALYISRAVKDDDKTIGDTKTGGSRVVLLPKRTIAVLSSWKSETAFPAPEHLIVSGAYGDKPMYRRSLNFRLGKALTKAEIQTEGRKLVVHSFRHYSEFRTITE